MSRAFVLLALLPLFLPPGFCACGAAASCCADEDDEAVEEIHVCQHGDAGQCDEEDHAAPRHDEHPWHHVPTCPAVTASRALQPRVNLALDVRLTDSSATVFFAQPAHLATLLPNAVLNPTEQPIYLRVRALLI
jgi:hypothetical protein